MVVLIDGVKYRHLVPENEAVLERWIEENYRYIFGEDSFYFAKKKIRSRAGIGTIPDAYLIIFDGKPKWCILEVELASHPVYEHVFPQLSKFRRAVEDGSSRKRIADFFYDTIKSDFILEAKIKKMIGSGEIHKFVYDLVAEKPMIVIAIDEKTAQLEEALEDFGGDVRVVEFKTFRREGVSGEVNAYIFEPIFGLKGIKITQVGKKIQEPVQRGDNDGRECSAEREQEAEYVQSYRLQLKNPDSLPSKIKRYIGEKGIVSKKELLDFCVLSGYKKSGSIGAALMVLEKDKFIKKEGRGDGARMISLQRDNS